METIVVINAGRYAARDGLPRIAPETIEYPCHDYVTKLVTHYDTAHLDRRMQQYWLSGYDLWAKIALSK